MRVVIGEDEALFREGLRLLLADIGVEVAATATDARDLDRLVRTQRPDLVITDIRMPPGLRDDGLQAAVRIREAVPDQPVVVLSQHVQREYALTLLETGPGGLGYLLKQQVADLRTFHADLVTVAGGGVVVAPELVAEAARNSETAGLGLTPRQVQVLELLAQGRSNAAIAAALNIAERSVKLHVGNIYEALGLAEHPDDHRRVLAVVRYLSRSGRRGS